MKSKYPITDKSSAMGDDAINRGITGQSLRDKSMSYDPATGKAHGQDVNLNHSGNPQFYADEDMD